MQQLLFSTTSSHTAPIPPPAPAPVKRGPGRPGMNAEEKARIAATKPLPSMSIGSRIGAGRPRKDGTHRWDNPNAPPGTKNTMDQYNESRAKREAAAAIKEEALAKKATLEYEVQQGNYLPRDAIISATARAYSALAQGIRSIPDMLERRLGLDPMVCVRIGEIQDEALASLHADLEKMMYPNEQNGDENGQ